MAEIVRRRSWGGVLPLGRGLALGAACLDQRLQRRPLRVRKHRSSSLKRSKTPANPSSSSANRHYWQNQLWSGCLAASSDEVGQVRDSGLVRDSEPSAKVVPEAEAELGTGLRQAEAAVPAIASGVAAGSAADLAPGHLGADVVLRSVGVQRDLGAVEHPQEFRLVGVQPCKQPVQDDEVGPTRKEPIKPRPQFGPSSRGRLSSLSLE